MGRRRTTPVVTVGEYWNALIADYGVAGSYGELIEALPQWTEYEYEVDLAFGTNYVPPVQTMFIFFAELYGGPSIHLDWYDPVNTIWAARMDAIEEARMTWQTASQRNRIENGSPDTDYALGLYGVSWA